MHLSFIGMSGVGKSYWAKQLAKAGYAHLDCDAALAKRLEEIIEVREDEDPVHAVGRWMGMPWTEGYAMREQRYLELECGVTEQAIECSDLVDTAIIDTTGSVIYAGEELLEQLKQSTRVVYFEVPNEARQSMIELYLREPKPVLWQGMYQPRADESQEAALARCYAALLANRAERYQSLADVVIDYHAVRQPKFGTEQLLEMIGN